MLLLDDCLSSTQVSLHLLDEVVLFFLRQYAVDKCSLLLIAAGNRNVAHLFDGVLQTLDHSPVSMIWQTLNGSLWLVEVEYLLRLLQVAGRDSVDVDGSCFVDLDFRSHVDWMGEKASRWFWLRWLWWLGRSDLRGNRGNFRHNTDDRHSVGSVLPECSTNIVPESRVLNNHSLSVRNVRL